MKVTCLLYLEQYFYQANFDDGPLTVSYDDRCMSTVSMHMKLTNKNRPWQHQKQNKIFLKHKFCCGKNKKLENTQQI